MSEKFAAAAAFSGQAGLHVGEATVSRLLSREGQLFGCALFFVGVILWQFKHVRGIGDGVIATAIFVLLPNLLQSLQRKMEQSSWRVCDLILRRVRLRS
jgi:hypothetical protein